jgi:hypothetical protein
MDLPDQPPEGAASSPSVFQIEIVRTPGGPPLIGKPVSLVEPDLRAVVAAGLVRDQQLGLLRLSGLLWRAGPEIEEIVADARAYGPEPRLVPHPRLAGTRTLLADLAVRMTPRSWQALALLTEGQDRLIRVLDLHPAEPPTKLLFQRSEGRWGAVVVDPADWPDLLAELIEEGKRRYATS